MGEVYRAKDSRLGRHVAVKSLPPGSADDEERIARFTREAQVLAALNHPNIASLYGVEESAIGGRSGASRFLILELVEGGTLAGRLRAGPLLVRDALTVGRQVADALHAAHEKGIIHRDLKPANIAFTSEGHAKVLDFGLAKAFLSFQDGSTVAGDATASGVVLGTAAS
jgi:serine/threonine-protein kinase